MRNLTASVRRSAIASFALTLGLVGVPFSAGISNAEESPIKYIKLIVNFVGEQPTSGADSVLLTLDGIEQPTFAFDLDANPDTLELVTSPLTPDLGDSGRIVSFSESNGAVDLADYVTTSYCYEHYDVLDPTWSDETHTGSVYAYSYVNYDCFITNTRKPANLTITNAVTETVVYPGGDLHYTMTATNNGHSTAENVLIGANLTTPVTDCKIGNVGSANPAPKLAVGASLVCKAMYQVPTDIVGDTLANTATVTSPSDESLPPAAIATVNIARVAVQPPTPTPAPTLMFHPVPPVRLFDTRTTTAQGVIPVVKKLYGGTSELKVKVTEQAGIPATGVSAVSLNITTTNSTDTGYITVYPCGTKPGVSSLNYTANQIVANAVIAPISAVGEICLFSSVNANLIADINGWIASSAGFNPVQPTRLVETRPTDPQGAITVVQKKYGGSSELKVAVAGAAGVPATGVGAVSLNVTAVAPTEAGFVTVYPCGTKPGVSSLNYAAGQIVANEVIVPVSAAGEICLYSSSNTFLIADINGWFAAGSDFKPLTPVRLLDTRPTEGQGAISVTKKVYGGATELKVTITGAGGVPSATLAAVSLNVTAVDPGDTGFVTVYPCGTRPEVSSLNYTAGQIVANAVITPLSSAGEICLYSSANAHLIVDANGYFAMSAAP